MSTLLPGYGVATGSYITRSYAVVTSRKFKYAVGTFLIDVLVQLLVHACDGDSFYLTEHLYLRWILFGALLLAL